MLTQETNDRLTRVGPGTPMGNLLRRYWFPIAITQELLAEPVQPARLLGEDLTVFRDTKGNIGVLGDRCAHRAISLAYGIPQDNPFLTHTTGKYRAIWAYGLRNIPTYSMPGSLMSST